MVGALVLIHNLFDPPLHHAEVLLRVDMLSLRFVLQVVNLTYVTLILLVTLKAVVDTSWGTRGLVEKRL